MEYISAFIILILSAFSGVNEDTSKIQHTPIPTVESIYEDPVGKDPILTNTPKQPTATPTTYNLIPTEGVDSLTNDYQNYEYKFDSPVIPTTKPSPTLYQYYRYTPPTPSPTPEIDIYGGASSYTKYGNTTYGSDGSSYTQYGNTVYGNDGSSYTRYGNTIYGNDGSSSTQYGNTTYSNDGSSSTQYGNTIYGSDGSSCTKYGNSTYCNEGY